MFSPRLAYKSTILLILAIFLFSISALGTTSQQSPETSNNGATSNKIVIAAVGDIMLGTTWPSEGLLPPNDGADILKEVSPKLSTANITFGNLEGPMLDNGTSSKCGSNSKNCFAFRVPTRYGKYLKDAGFDVMSLANNHAGDFGSAGLSSSRSVLDNLGIAHSGEIGDIARLSAEGKKIALIGFATNNIAYNLNNIEQAKKAVSEAAASADIVIVSFHGGGEGAPRQNVPYGTEIYLGENRGDLRKFTHAVIDAGADLVIGHGPHVVRGMEVYKNHLIAYSLGNFATYGPFNLNGPCGLSLILEAHIGLDGSFLGGKVHPVKQEKPGGPRLDSNNAVIPVINRLSQDDFGTTAVTVKDDGTLVLPVAQTTK